MALYIYIIDGKITLCYAAAITNQYDTTWHYTQVHWQTNADILRYILCEASISYHRFDINFVASLVLANRYFVAYCFCLFVKPV